MKKLAIICVFTFGILSTGCTLESFVLNGVDITDQVNGCLQDVSNCP